MERSNGFTYIRRQGQMISPGVSRRPPMHQKEPLTQHDELIKYINEAWINVTESASVSHGNTTYYRCDRSKARLPGFTPFDLDSIWNQKFTQNLRITAQGHQ